MSKRYLIIYDGTSKLISRCIGTPFMETSVSILTYTFSFLGNRVYMFAKRPRTKR